MSEQSENLISILSLLANGDRKTIDKDEIAKLLRTSPEALATFEQAYTTQVLNSGVVSNNLFEVNAKQAAMMHSGVSSNDMPQLEEMKKRIVNELLAKTQVWKFDGQTYGLSKVLYSPVDNSVTNEEIKKLPESLRPQLTGELMKIDINESTYEVLLDMYWHYLNEKDPQVSQLYYHMFRQVLDILDLDEITRRIIATNKNAMGYWLPKITGAALATKTLKIPKTTIIKVPTTMLQLTRSEYTELTRTTLDIVDDFCRQAFDLDESQEYFIKTGTYSSKFDFRNAYVHGAKEVRELGEYLLFIHYQALQMASPLAGPKVIYGVSTTDEWVVREFIQDKENNPTIYKGLPLHTEYRIFVDFDTKQIIGMNPYWDPKVMKERFGHSPDSNSPHNIHDYIIYQMHEKTLMERYKDNIGKVKKYVEDLIGRVDDLSGQWSIDIMQNGADFWLIDMALAENSALYDCVPMKLRKHLPEEWLPRLSGE